MGNPFVGEPNRMGRKFEKDKGFMMMGKTFDRN